MKISYPSVLAITIILILIFGIIGSFLFAYYNVQNIPNHTVNDCPVELFYMQGEDHNVLIRVDCTGDTFGKFLVPLVQHDLLVTIIPNGNKGYFLVIKRWITGNQQLINKLFEDNFKVSE